MYNSQGICRFMKFFAFGITNQQKHLWIVLLVVVARSKPKTYTKKCTCLFLPQQMALQKNCRGNVGVSGC